MIAPASHRARRAAPAGGSLDVISLFSGAGGLDLGLEEAGWRLRCQVDADRDAAETLRLRPRSRGESAVVLESRIEDVDPRALRQRFSMRRGDLGLLAGGPPCQPFTTSGLRQAIRDPRASTLFPSYLGFVREFRPRFLLMENVDGLLSAALRHRPLNLRGRTNSPLDPDEQKGSFLRWLVGELVGLGYAVAWGVLEAADHGVPQLRQRAILICARGREVCYLPEPTFGRPGLPPYRTLRDALGHVRHLGPVQPLSARKCAVYELVPPGGNWRDLPLSLQRSTMGAAFLAEGGKSGWWRRLSWDAPSPTILGMPDHSSTALVHPDEVRCLSANECALVQTFPAGTQFAGTSRSQYQQIGNAVPPVLGEALGRHLLSFLRGARPATPSPPLWRQVSANRRIGTHGWATSVGGRAKYTLNVKVRPDHIWATDRRVQQLG